DSLSLQIVGQPDVHFAASIPEEPVLVEMDGTMIGQALTNLLKNAGEATQTYIERHGAEGYRPEIQLRLTQDRDKVTIKISDNGIGLPEDRARLFEPYVTTRGEGTGLGLPIVKKIIEEHGGTLILTDAEVFAGQDHAGACAIIQLPAVSA
ncbi:MAG: ATP-binding protein, partial [Paracoccaceae bacterium]|nr:ATP-binding protein [Paracoccaceae bacterium]